MNSPKRILLAAVLTYAASLPAHADCVLPPAPSKIPDGNTASQQEMLTAMQTLKVGPGAQTPPPTPPAATKPK